MKISATINTVLNKYSLYIGAFKNTQNVADIVSINKNQNI
jgi:hypothetical protein